MGVDTNTNRIVVDRWNLSLTSYDSYVTNINYSCSGSTCRGVKVGGIERYTSSSGTDALLIPYSKDIDGYDGYYRFNAGLLSLIVNNNGSLSFGNTSEWNYQDDDFNFGIISNGNRFVFTRYNENYSGSSNNLLLRLEVDYNPYSGSTNYVFEPYSGHTLSPYYFEYYNLYSSVKSNIYQSVYGSDLRSNIVVPLLFEFSAFGNIISDDNRYYYSSYVNPNDNSYALAGSKYQGNTTVSYPFIATYSSNNNLIEERLFTEFGYEGRFRDIIIGPDEQIIGVGSLYRTDYDIFIFIYLYCK